MGRNQLGTAAAIAGFGADRTAIALGAAVARIHHVVALRRRLFHSDFGCGLRNRHRLCFSHRFSLAAAEHPKHCLLYTSDAADDLA